jgi:hypothetical protein
MKYVFRFFQPFRLRLAVQLAKSANKGEKKSCILAFLQTLKPNADENSSK